MRIIYKYLWELVKFLKPKVSKFNQFLNVQNIKLQRQYQNVCKHNKLKQSEFFETTYYVCQDCKAHGSYEVMTKKL